MRRYIHPLLLLLPALFISCGDETPRLDEEGNSVEGTLEADIKVESPTFSVINILRASGQKVRVPQQASRPAMQTDGYVLDVNQGVTLEVYEYATADDLERVRQQMSPDGTSIGSESIGWDSPVHLYSTEKVIIAYLGDDMDTRQSLETLFGQKEFAGTGAR